VTQLAAATRTDDIENRAAAVKREAEEDWVRAKPESDNIHVNSLKPPADCSWPDYHRERAFIVPNA
jgi:hypothetical protein